MPSALAIRWGVLTSNIIGLTPIDDFLSVGAVCPRAGMGARLKSAPTEMDDFLSVGAVCNRAGDDFLPVGAVCNRAGMGRA